MKRLLLLACALGVPVLAAQNGPEQLTALSTEVLVARAAQYAQRFERSMAAVVLEERYVQIIKNWTLPPGGPDETHLEWAEDLSQVRPDVIVKERRQTRSDVLLVQLPNQTWAAFRDTFEVNGRSRRGRDDRLRKLFLEQTEDSRRQLRRINQASADWNLGGFYRDINLPTSAVFLLHPRNQRRFTFVAGEPSEVQGVGCRLVTLKEHTKPTVLRSWRGKDVPLTGNACIDVEGRVWRTRLDLDPHYTTRGMIEVTYRSDQHVDVLVPDRMWEWYYLPQEAQDGRPMYVEGLARYSNLRQFTVTTTER
jgi:hypothetical protein